jgi:hypothetical protein
MGPPLPIPEQRAHSEGCLSKGGRGQSTALSNRPMWRDPMSNREGIVSHSSSRRRPGSLHRERQERVSLRSLTTHSYHTSHRCLDPGLRRDDGSEAYARHVSDRAPIRSPSPDPERKTNNKGQSRRRGRGIKGEGNVQKLMRSTKPDRNGGSDSARRPRRSTGMTMLV